MRALTWLLLVVLVVVVSVGVGRPGLALGLASVKALLVGRQFMELKHAHRLHWMLFAAAVCFAGLVLAVLLAR